MPLSDSTDRFFGVIASLAIKAPCAAVATSQTTLSGSQSIDSFTTGDGDRILCIAQTDQKENGIYSTSSSAWQRAADFDGNRDIVKGTLVTVDHSSGSARQYIITTPNPITIGVTNINFALAIDFGGTTAAGTTTGAILVWDGSAWIENTDVLVLAGEVRLAVPLKIAESADDVADTAGHGQVWVRTDNNLMYTEEDGTQHIIGGPSFVGGYLSLSATGRVEGSDNADVNIADNVVIIGTDAFENAADTDLAGSVVIGTRAMQNATLSRADGSSVAIGLEAFQDNVNSISGQVVAIGTRALKQSQVQSTSSTSQYVAVGFEAGERLGDNTQNNSVLIGYRAGRGSTINNFVTANSCVYIGSTAGQNQSSGGFNIGIGRDAMNTGTITGSNNIAIGQAAGQSLAGGGENILFGSLAGSSLTTGSLNIIIGDDCAINLNDSENIILSPDGYIAASGQGNVIFGYRAASTAGGVFFPIDADNNFVVESVTAAGVDRQTFLYGRLDQGNLLLGKGSGTSGRAGANDREWGGGENVFAILDTASVPSGAPPNASAMYSASGVLIFPGDVQVLGSLSLDDNQEIALGDAGDFTIVFDGTNIQLASVVGSFDIVLTDLDVNMQDGQVIRAVLLDYAIESDAPTVSANAVTLDYTAGPTFEVDLEPATATVTVTISGGPPAGTYGQVTVKLQQDGSSAQSLTWAGGTFRWAGGTPHTMNAALDGFSLFTFETWDGGTTWYGAGADYS